jgi:hypothetical protein
MKHTPEPWTVKGYDIYAEGEYICTTSGNATANAKLIAAAPDLLENLIRILDRIKESDLIPCFPSAYKRAKAAIEKATIN